MKRPFIIGITGGIGSGKSTLSDKLRSDGFKVYDSDFEARRLQNEHPLIRKQLIKLFGTDIYTEQGLNRSLLAQLVFGNKELLSKLNQIVHPVVKDDFLNWIELHAACKLLFLESAILFESGFNQFVDKVIVITACEEIRINRVVKRDGISPEQVRARISSQLPEDNKISKADFVIYSDDDLPLVDKMRNIIIQLNKQY